MVHQPGKLLNPSHSPIYFWIIYVGLIVFGIFLLHWYGIIDTVIEADSTKLSVVIFVVFFICLLFLSRPAWHLGQLRREVKTALADPQSKPDLWLMKRINRYNTSNTDDIKNQLTYSELSEQISNKHGFGWYCTDILTKLGLIGTIIGFILMLGTIYSIQDQEISALQELINKMGAGMKVALYTTLTGISCSLLLGVVCKVLDGFAESLAGFVVDHLLQENE